MNVLRPSRLSCPLRTLLLPDQQTSRLTHRWTRGLSVSRSADVRRPFSSAIVVSSHQKPEGFVFTPRPPTSGLQPLASNLQLPTSSLCLRHYGQKPPALRTGAAAG